MNLFVLVLVAIVRAVLSVECLLMFVRAVLSWIMPEAEGGILDFLYYLTEPLIVPVRKVLSGIPAFQELPFDLSFMITNLLMLMVLMVMTV